MDGSCNKGSSVIDTELTVRVNTETTSALILRQFMLLDGCAFACEKSSIMSARGPPRRILNFKVNKQIQNYDSEDKYE